MNITAETTKDVELGSDARLRYEPFESRHLGGSAYSLVLPTKADRFNFVFDAFEQWRHKRPAPRLVTARACNAAQEVALTAAGFRRIETTVTLARSLADVSGLVADPRVEVAQPDDEADCVAIGGSAFSYDRFHHDPNIGKSAADAIKAEWVHNGLRGRADRAFVARHGEKAMGFNLCMLRGGEPWIDLIAVDASARRQGLARALVEASLVYYATRAHARMNVGTQADNTESLTLYVRCGFVETGRQGVYHLTPARS